MRKKPIALQEMHGTTTAEASRFLLGQKTYVARKWLLGWCFAMVWRLLPAIFEYTGEQGFSALSGSMLKKTLRAMKKPQNKTCGPSASSKQY